MTSEVRSEEWKPVSGYEGIYEISSLCRIRSLDRKHKLSGPKGGIRGVKGKLCRGVLNANGYRVVALCGKIKPIHRIFAEHFIPNPMNKPFINHINGIKTDNRIENLEWCTVGENNRHAIATGLRRSNSTARMSKYCKPVVAIRDLVILEFASIHQCARELGVTKRTINDTINKNYHCKGFKLYL